MRDQISIFVNINISISKSWVVKQTALPHTKNQAWSQAAWSIDRIAVKSHGSLVKRSEIDERCEKKNYYLAAVNRIGSSRISVSSQASRLTHIEWFMMPLNRWQIPLSDSLAACW